MSTFAVCLDPNSPNFNVNTLSSNGFSVYSDADNFTTPIAQNIPVANLLPPPNGNCPVLVNVPQGATQIIVIDQCDDTIDTAAIFNPVDVSAGTLATNCCYSIIDLPEIPIPWCVECGIEFDTYNTSSIGRIVAGNVISSCGPVTDYVIGWYLNGDYSAPAITTGLNTTANFTFQYPHPLIGNSSVPVLAGNYEGIIHDIIINGVTYSSVSGSANGVPIPFESCFDTVVIDPLSCDNGTSPGKYSHHVVFNSQAPGATSSPTSLTYQLSPSTQYFAYAFRASSVWDELEIKWVSGDPSATSNPTLYSQPIYLEKLQIGADTPGAFPFSTLPTFPNNPTLGGNSSAIPPTVDNVWPKKTAHPAYFQRVLTLTNLETSSNLAAPDLLEITIKPNPTNNNTQWEAGFQCLDAFDCTDCFFDDYPDSLPTIWKVELDKQYGCDKQRIRLHMSGCKAGETSDWAGPSMGNLSSPNINLVGAFRAIGGAGILDVPWTGYGSWFNLSGNTTCVSSGAGGNLSCAPSTPTTITLNKTPNFIQLTFNSVNDYLHYKNNLISTFNDMGVSSPVSCNYNITGILPYYQLFRLYIPSQAPTANCGDNTTILQYDFHVNDYFNIQYVEDPSSNFWSITIPQTPIVNCYPNNLGSCDSCYSSINAFVSAYNSVANNPTTFSLTTNLGAKFAGPFSRYWIFRNITGGASGSACNLSYPGSVQVPFYAINTIPFISSSQSTTGWVNLPSLGASLPCSLSPYPYGDNNSGWYGGVYVGRYNSYQVRFLNLTSSFNYSLSTNDFEIYSLSNSNFTGSIDETQNVWPLPCPDPSGSLIYSYIGGVATMYSSSYFWQGNAPVLVIDP